MDPVLVPAMAIGLIAAYPGWLMCQKAYYTARWKIATVLAAIVIPPILAYPLFFIPFWVSKGKDVGPYDTFTDMLIFTACPIGVIALIAYVLDFLAETPGRAVVAGAACFAIMLLPFGYYFYAAKLHSDFEINVTDTDVPPTPAASPSSPPGNDGAEVDGDATDSETGTSPAPVGSAGEQSTGAPDAGNQGADDSTSTPGSGTDP